MIVVAYLALNAWFRAGYLRSLIGHLHWGPADGRQFRRLLGLTLFYELISWGFSFAFVTLGFDGPDADPGDRAAMLAQVVIVASLIVSLLLLYVDYAIVVSGTSLWHSFRRSLATVRDNRLISVLVTIVPAVFVLLSTTLTDGLAGSALQVLPTVVIVVVAWGALAFVIDVVLVVRLCRHARAKPSEVRPPMALRRLRSAIATRTAEQPEKGLERQVTVQAGRVFGLDLRPSRLFFWLGERHDHEPYIVSLERKPRVLRYPRQRRFVHVGSGRSPTWATRW